MAKNGYFEVCHRWQERLLGKTTQRNLSNPRMPVNDDAIFSYGPHFPLVVATRDRKGNPTGLILNGDRNSVTTARHQREVRSMAQRSGLPHVIVPFAALSAAGIDPADVEIVDVTPDRTEVKTTVTNTIPPGNFFKTNQDMAWVPLDDADVEKVLDRKHAEALEDHARKVQYHAEAVAEGNESRASLWARYAEMDPPARPTVESLGGRSTSNSYWGRWDCRYEWVGSRVGLMQGAFGNHGYSPWSWEMTTFGYLPAESTTLLDGLDGVNMGIGAALMCFLTSTPRFTFTRERHRHWLGGSLLRAKLRWVVRSRCKTCADHHPDRPAFGNGLTITNDELELEVWARAVARPERREWDIRFEVQQEHRCPDCTNGIITRNMSRTAYYISDFDANEPRPLYFFCELPRKAKPETLAEAIEALKPEPVLMAEQMGHTITRQGDIFAIEVPTKTRRQLKAEGATFEKMGELLGTNHVATEVARMPDGTTLARGTMHHKPPWRGPDHIRAKLTDGKTWHVIVKNAVPLSR